MAIGLDRKKQFGLKVESPLGSKAVLTASDYGLELSSIAVKGEPEGFAKNVYADTIDQAPARAGKSKGSFTISGMLKNSGTLNTEPKIANVLRASRMPSTAVKGMAFTAATGALKPLFDTITGGTSGAKARAVKIEGTKLYFALISGTFSSTETLTASPSGWTATSGAVDATATGFIFVPDSSIETAFTATANEDGVVSTLIGSASTFSLDLNTGAEPTFSATISGIMDTSTWGTGVAPVSGVVMESHSPAVVANAGLAIDGTTMELVQRVTIDAGNTVVVLEDLNSAFWMKYAQVTARAVKGTLELLRGTILNTYGVFQKFIAKTTGIMTFSIGSGAGTAIEVIVPGVQYSGISPSNKDGNILLSLEWNGTHADTYKDGAFGIWFR